MKIELLGYLADPTQQARDAVQQADNTDNTYYIRQKLIGFSMLLTGIVAPVLSTEGITASLFCIPFGLAMLFGKGELIND